MAGHPPDRAPGSVSAASFPCAGFVNTRALTRGCKGKSSVKALARQRAGNILVHTSASGHHQGEPPKRTETPIPVTKMHPNCSQGLPQRQLWCGVRGESLAPPTWVETPQLLVLRARPCSHMLPQTLIYTYAHTNTHVHTHTRQNAHPCANTHPGRALSPAGEYPGSLVQPLFPWLLPPPIPPFPHPSFLSIHSCLGFCVDFAQVSEVKWGGRTG